MADAPVSPQPGRGGHSFGRFVGVAALAVVTLFLLQFAVQAAFNSPLQGLLSFIATAAFAVATYRLVRHQSIVGLLFVATLPLFFFSLVATFIYPDESPIYAAVTAIPPMVSGLIWVLRRPAAKRESIR